MSPLSRHGLGVSFLRKTKRNFEIVESCSKTKVLLFIISHYVVITTLSHNICLSPHLIVMP